MTNGRFSPLSQAVDSYLESTIRVEHLLNTDPVAAALQAQKAGLTSIATSISDGLRIAFMYTQPTKARSDIEEKASDLISEAEDFRVQLSAYLRARNNVTSLPDQNIWISAFWDLQKALQTFKTTLRWATNRRLGMDHGYDKAISGGTDIMQQLVRNLRQEQLEGKKQATKLAMRYLELGKYSRDENPKHPQGKI